MDATVRRHHRRLMVAGAVDSLGLALGWTVFNLLAVHRDGLTVTAGYSAAMLLGVALAAPATTHLTHRLHNCSLLRLTAGVEAVLRATVFVLLIQGGPPVTIAATIVFMNVVAWTGYAGMRAEMAATERQAASLSRFAGLILAAEAAGASLAAVLPLDVSTTHQAAVFVVAVVYVASLFPTMLVARSARVRPSGRPGQRRVRKQQPRRLLATGGVLMVLGSGPMLLYVVLADDFHGRGSVAVAAIAFTIGTLVAPSACALVERVTRVDERLLPFWACGMVVGWAVAPWHVAGLALAQLCSGISVTNFEGTMDASAAGPTKDGAMTSSLAYASASRALGGAVSVRLLPLWMASFGFGHLVLTAAVVPLAVGAIARSRTLPDKQAQTSLPGLA